MASSSAANKPETVVIRGIGPSLSAFGVANALADPFLTVHNSQGTAIGSNDNWETTQKQALIDSRLAPTNSKEAAILTDLQRNYTAVVAGVKNGTGIGVVEVYNITPQYQPYWGGAVQTALATRHLLFTIFYSRFPLGW